MIHNISEVVRRFKQEWTSQLDDRALEQVCREKGMTWRRTILNPITTIKVFFLQILHGNTACEHLHHLARMSFTGAAYCQARMRVPLSVFQTLLARTASRMKEEISDRGRWLGIVCFMWTGPAFPCRTNPLWKKNLASRQGRKRDADFRWRTSWH